MSIKLISAVDRNFGIGYKNDLLFKIPEDLGRFKKITTGHFVVMGRKTYESLPSALPNRTNVVLTTNKDFKPNEYRTIVEHSAQKIINHYLSGEQEKDLFIIGGRALYSEFAEYADTIYLTFIDKEADKVDTYFPKEILHDFVLDEKTQGKMYDEKENCLVLYNKYNRKEGDFFK